MTPGNSLTHVPGLGFRVPGSRRRTRIWGNPERETRNPQPHRRGDGAGFTLIELLIVMMIIGILASISMPMFTNALRLAREAALRENLFVLRDAIDKYYADNDKYPESLADLVDRRYIRKVPNDPITGSAETWQVVTSTDDKGGQQTGISDVKSGSDGTGSDGHKYAEW